LVAGRDGSMIAFPSGRSFPLMTLLWWGIGIELGAVPTAATMGHPLGGRPPAGASFTIAESITEFGFADHDMDRATMGVTLASVPAAVSGTDLLRIPPLDPPPRTDHPRIAR